MSADQLVRPVDAVDAVHVERSDDPVFALHRGGKLATIPSVPLRDGADLSMAYTPGVARVCEAIASQPELLREYTWVRNTVAIVTDGTAVLGLGNIGPRAAMPVMEGKAVLFKQFGGVDAVPICLDCTDVDDVVETVVRLAPSFGGINLEDIAAPRCFEIERRLRDRLDIPVFHDDQHGTAIVVLAALRGALALTARRLETARIVISGAGAAGVAVTKTLRVAGATDIVVADSRGVISPARTDLTPAKAELAETTNARRLVGDIHDALCGADVFIGVSGGAVASAAIEQMAPEAIVFALANPTPEVHPDVARRHARIVATGRSDFPNQINNVLAFPGMFRGAFDAGVRQITEEMKQAAAGALAALVANSLSDDYVIPSPFDDRVCPAVAEAVAQAAVVSR
jgi:malate dehydrogenase (oxaloacetate-decarboxylating)